MKLAKLLSAHGAATSKGGQDCIPAFINEEEARLLKRRGGSGRVDPLTGMLHFEGEDGWSGDNTVSDNAFSADYGPGTSYGAGSEASGSSGSNVGSLDVDATPGRSDTAFGKGGELEGFANSLGNLADELNMTDPSTGFGTGTNSRGQTYGYDVTNNQYGFHTQDEWDAISDAYDTGKDYFSAPSANTALNSWGQWANANPWSAGLLGLGLGLVNPIAGLMYNVATSASRGNTPGTVSGLAGYFGGPIAGLTAGTIANFAEGKNASATGGLANAALNSTGYGLGQILGQNFDRGSIEQALASYAGNQAQGYGIGAGLGALGISNSGQGWGVGGPSATDFNNTSSADSGDYVGVGSISAPSPSMSVAGFSTPTQSSSSQSALSSLLYPTGNTSSGYAPFSAYSTPFNYSQTSAPLTYNAPIQQLPENIKNILAQREEPKSIYQNRGRLSDVLNAGDYYGN